MQTTVEEQEEWAGLIAQAQALGLERLAAQIAEAGPEHNALYAEMFENRAVLAQDAEDELERIDRGGWEARLNAIDTYGPNLVTESGEVAESAVLAMAEHFGMAKDDVRAMLEDSAQVAEDRKMLLVDSLRYAGQESVAAMLEKLDAGTSEVSSIVRDYAAAIADGVNPVIQQLGGQAVVVRPGSFVPGSQGGLKGYASGGFHEDHVAQIAPAGAWRVWAEDETAGEALIPLASVRRCAPQLMEVA